MTELILVRHGQSEANVGLSGDPDCDLTSLGREQARGVAQRLEDFDLAGFTGVTSPYRRALRTSEEIARATGLAFSDDDAVREWGAEATVCGRTFAKEPVEDAVRRLEDFLRRRRGQRLLVVSHAAPIALLTQLAWGEKPVTEGQFWLGVGNCCPRWLNATAL